MNVDPRLTAYCFSHRVMMVIRDREPPQRAADVTECRHQLVTLGCGHRTTVVVPA